jgi:hypothetical protein
MISYGILFLRERERSIEYFEHTDRTVVRTRGCETAYERRETRKVFR